MNRMTRGAVAAALAATVALGASAPAAVAGPKADHAKATHKTVKATKADKAKATKAERALLKQSTRKQAYLTRLLDSNKLERLEDTAEGAVRKNIEGDIAELAALTAPPTTTPTAPSPTTADGTTPTATTPPAGVRDYRPEVYHTIINQLRLATRLQAAAGELAEGTDPAAVPSLTELGTLATTLMTYDALTERSELRAAQRTLSAAQAAIEEADGSEDETETETGTDTSGGTGTTADAS